MSNDKPTSDLAVEVDGKRIAIAPNSLSFEEGPPDPIPVHLEMVLARGFPGNPTSITFTIKTPNGDYTGRIYQQPTNETEARRG